MEGAMKVVKYIVILFFAAASTCYARVQTQAEKLAVQKAFLERQVQRIKAGDKVDPLMRTKALEFSAAIKKDLQDKEKKEQVYTTKQVAELEQLESVINAPAEGQLKVTVQQTPQQEELQKEEPQEEVVQEKVQEHDKEFNQLIHKIITQPWVDNVPNQDALKQAVEFLFKDNYCIKRPQTAARLFKDVMQQYVVIESYHLKKYAQESNIIRKIKQAQLQQQKLLIEKILTVYQRVLESSDDAFWDLKEQKITADWTTSLGSFVKAIGLFSVDLSGDDWTRFKGMIDRMIDTKYKLHNVDIVVKNIVDPFMKQISDAAQKIQDQWYTLIGQFKSQLDNLCQKGIVPDTPGEQNSTNATMLIKLVQETINKLDKVSDINEIVKEAISKYRDALYNQKRYAFTALFLGQIDTSQLFNDISSKLTNLYDQRIISLGYNLIKEAEQIVQQKQELETELVEKEPQGKVKEEPKVEEGQNKGEQTE